MRDCSPQLCQTLLYFFRLFLWWGQSSYLYKNARTTHYCWIWQAFILLTVSTRPPICTGCKMRERGSWIYHSSHSMPLERLLLRNQGLPPCTLQISQVGDWELRKCTLPSKYLMPVIGLHRTTLVQSNMYETLKPLILLSMIMVMQQFLGFCWYVPQISSRFWDVRWWVLSEYA